MMADDEMPNHATFYVAHAVANKVLVDLALSIAADLTVVMPDERETKGRRLLHELLSRFTVAADFKPHTLAATIPELGPYDAHEAETIAADIVGDAILDIRARLHL
jgi:hypothetical protein